MFKSPEKMGPSKPEFKKEEELVESKSEEKPEVLEGEVSPEKEIPLERYKLKGEKREIEYSGMPLEVYLGDKNLQIIDVREDPRWNADFLLIDPATFDQSNPTEGFKGIREGESFAVGRETPWRFKFPGTVSRAHLRVELKEGKLIVEDLRSTNGTVIESRRPERAKKEAEAVEVAPERERAIAEFREYVARHHSEIERELQQGRDLEDIFYHDFYNRNIDNLKYQESDPAAQRLKEAYKKSVDAVQENLVREMNAKIEKGGSDIMPMANEYWLYCNVNGGCRGTTDLGRFYLNLKPEQAPQFYTQVVEAFRRTGLHAQMKIPRAVDADAFNRLDKMVIYFNATEEKQALRVLETLYRGNQAVFDETGIPRFTAEVCDASGKSMIGVGFAEEPPFRNESFGLIRAKVLAEVYLNAKHSGLTISDPRFDFEVSFRRACQQYQVDPINPAFNLSREPQKFEGVRKSKKI